MNEEIYVKIFGFVKSMLRQIIIFQRIMQVV